MLSARWRQLSLLDLLPSPLPEILRRSPKTVKEAAPSAVNRFEHLCRGPYAGIRITVSPRMRKGWKLEWRRGSGANLTLSKNLGHAPNAVVLLALDWALLTQRRRLDATAKGVRRNLEKQLHAWIDGHPDTEPKDVLRASRRATRYLERLQARGKHHDLESIFAAINAEYFGGALKARITWSSRWGGLSTQSLRKDAQGNPYHLLTISRGYDHPSATPEIVGGVVYHECLHIAVPTEEREGRRVVHGREFRRREKEYRHYGEWLRWHRETLPRILKRGP